MSSASPDAIGRAARGSARAHPPNTLRAAPSWAGTGACSPAGLAGSSHTAEATPSTQGSRIGRPQDGTRRALALAGDGVAQKTIRSGEHDEGRPLEEKVDFHALLTSVTQAPARGGATDVMARRGAVGAGDEEYSAPPSDMDVFLSQLDACVSPLVTRPLPSAAAPPPYPANTGLTVARPSMRTASRGTSRESDGLVARTTGRTAHMKIKPTRVPSEVSGHDPTMPRAIPAALPQPPRPALAAAAAAVRTLPPRGVLFDDPPPGPSPGLVLGAAQPAAAAPSRHRKYRDETAEQGIERRVRNRDRMRRLRLIKKQQDAQQYDTYGGAIPLADMSIDYADTSMGSSASPSAGLFAASGQAGAMGDDDDSPQRVW